jgi:hypothetical protein
MKRASAVLALVLSSMTFVLSHQRSPLIQLVAFRRPVLSGIPQGPTGAPSPNVLSPEYFIYLVSKEPVPLSTVDACIAGNRYSATLNPITSPVEIDRDPAVPTRNRLVLVPKTKNYVYQVQLEQQHTNHCVSNPTKSVIVQIRNASIAWCIAAPLKELNPKSAM